MAGRSWMTSIPPFSCLKRSTELRLWTSSQFTSPSTPRTRLIATPLRQTIPDAAPEGLARPTDCVDFRFESAGGGRTAAHHPPGTCAPGFPGGKNGSGAGEVEGYVTHL